MRRRVFRYGERCHAVRSGAAPCGHWPRSRSGGSWTYQRKGLTLYRGGRRPRLQPVGRPKCLRSFRVPRAMIAYAQPGQLARDDFAAGGFEGRERCRLDEGVLDDVAEVWLACVRCVEVGRRSRLHARVPRAYARMAACVPRIRGHAPMAARMRSLARDSAETRESRGASGAVAVGLLSSRTATRRGWRASFVANCSNAAALLRRGRRRR